MEAFKECAFNIFKQKIPNELKNWKRFSDSCGVQFWSKYVGGNMSKMCTLLALNQISHNRFEANEGKNVSDILIKL